MSAERRSPAAAVHSRRAGPPLHSLDVARLGRVGATRRRVGPTAAPAAADRRTVTHPASRALTRDSTPSAHVDRAAATSDGITTAEYAVGTAAGAGLAGLLYKLLTGGFGDQLLQTLFDHVLGLLGIG